MAEELLEVMARRAGALLAYIFAYRRRCRKGTVRSWWVGDKGKEERRGEGAVYSSGMWMSRMASVN